MGSDVKKSLATAEKLLKQGKVDDAVTLCDELIDDSRGDLLTVNRVGDILAATGYGDRAVVYYARIADQFARQGYYPKAIAIRKKILRLTPDDPAALVALGDVYVAQEHPGEARTFYLRAADSLLQAKNFDAARDVYTRLVTAEPDDPRHRVRLAETRAAAGDAQGAAHDLIALGERLLQSGKPDDAEKAFLRAEELAPELPAIARGLIGCLIETGREDEAIERLEAEAAKPEPAAELLGELVQLSETGGRPQRVDELLRSPQGAAVPESALKAITRYHERLESLDGWWARFQQAMQHWRENNLGDGRGFEWLERFAGWTNAPFADALAVRLETGRGHDDDQVRARLLERLIALYRETGRETDAEPLLEELCDVRPDSPLIEQATAPADETVAEAAPAAAVLSERAEVPVEYEAPAVPLSRADEEFVSGRLTQAEILEKYGLLSQALDQLYEVVERFPGHLDANQRLVTLLRNDNQSAPLGVALVRLALARRAAGRVDVAKQSASEAEKLGGVDATMRPILAALGLLEGGAPVAAAPPVAETPVAEPTPAPTPAPAPPVAATPAPAEATSDPARESVIDFDSFDDDDDDESDEVIEIEETVETEVAAEPVAATPPPAPPAPPAATDDVMTFAPLPSLDDGQEDDDLSAIAAALDEELFDDDPLPSTPESESEESLDEVFAAFRERVQEEVSGEDYRTHYDLGIGYKEMGLVDAAIAEFEISLKAEELFQESCSMLAICHRERDELDQAAAWYRRALESGPVAGLQYDLAEVLLQAGDATTALDLFRDVMEGDPSFRDVQAKVSELAASVAD